MKNKIKNIKIKEHINKIKEDLVVDKLNAIEWAVLGVLLLAITVTLFYGDNIGIFLTSFWANEDIFMKGSLRALGNNQLPYGIVHQAFCFLWTFPANIIYRFVKFSDECAPLVIWFKLSMSFIMTLCMKEMLSIGGVLNISKERCKWMLILFCSTILVALPVFHIAQTDIMYTYFSLLGIKAYLKNDNKRFIAFFAMSISCKLIAVLVFIPLILLREKRIPYIARDTVLGCIILVVERGWYKLIRVVDALIARREYVEPTRPVYRTIDGEQTIVTITMDQANEDFVSHFYNKALFFEFPAIRKGYVASVLVVLFVLLCIWCYVQKREDEQTWMHKAIYTVAIAWLIFFANASPTPYWIVVMYPAMFLLVFMKPERIKINMLIQNVFTISMFLIYVVSMEWVFGGPSNLDKLLLRGLLKEGHDSESGPAVYRYLHNMGIDNYMNVIISICLAATIAIAVINHPKCKINEELSDKEEKKLMHGFAIWQIGFLAIWYMVNVWVVQRW